MRSVLIVDDDQLMVRTLSDVLRGQGWQVHGVHSGEEAVAAAAARPWSVVLMDVRMSQMSGVEALKAMRRQDPELPVLLMTAYSASEWLEDAATAGVKRVLAKPFAMPDLLTTLAATARRPRAVLVVDDDPQFLDTLCALLAARGMQVARASGLDQALVALREFEPPVVLLDLKLDHRPPREAVVAIHGTAPAARLILCSAYQDLLDQTLAELPPDWFDAVLKKPLVHERLFALLDDCLSR